MYIISFLIFITKNKEIFVIFGIQIEKYFIYIIIKYYYPFLNSVNESKSYFQESERNI